MQKRRISLGNLREILEKASASHAKPVAKKKFNIAVARIIRNRHITPEGLSGVLKIAAAIGDYTPESLENCAAISHLWANLPIEAKSRIKGAFIYGSTAQGKASLFPHYVEEIHYRKGKFIKSRFTVAPSELQGSDVDFAIIAPNAEEIKDHVRKAMVATHVMYPKVNLTVKLFPEDKLVHHIKKGKTSVPRRILLFSDHIALTGDKYLNFLKRLSLRYSGLEKSLVTVDLRNELDMRTHKRIGRLLHQMGVTDFDLPAKDFARIMPFEYQARAHGIDEGSPREYAVKLSLPKRPKLRRTVSA